jgi:HlyD family secretion protein
MKARVLRVVLVVLVVAAIGVAGAKLYPRWLEPSAPATELVLYGNIDIREADLAFNVAGRIESMQVEEGDEVEAGQLLATLEADLYQAEVDADAARVGARRAALDRLLAGTRPEEISAERSNVQAIEADLADARSTLERTEKLARQDFATRQKLDDDRARVQNLEARLSAAQQKLALAIQGPRVEDITEARAQLTADEAELALAQRRLAYTELHAKRRGVVKTRIVEPGAVVLANAPVYTIALSDPVWVRSYVSEPDLGRIHPGMSATVVTDSAPDKPYDAWIGFISPVAEFTPKTVETAEVRTSLVYRIRVYIKNPDGGLRQGMPVTIRIETGAEPGGTPTSASH